MQTSLTFKGLDTIRRGLAEAPELTRRELLAAMKDSVNHLQSDVVGHFPTSGAGTTRNSISGEAYVHDAGVLGVVASSSPVAGWIEFGTRPHPIDEDGIEAIVDWAMRKHHLGEEEARNLAHGYAWKVRAHGTPAKNIFRDALDRSLPVIARNFEDAAERIAAQLLGNGGLQ